MLPQNYYLLKKGRLSDVYKYLQKNNLTNPNSLQVKEDLAWLYDAYCKKYSQKGDINNFCIYFDKLLSLNIHDNNNQLNKSLCWRIIVMLKNGSKLVSNNDLSLLCDKLFEYAKKIYPIKPSHHYSELFKVFFSFRKSWGKIYEFCDWWNYDNFLEEDYCLQINENYNTYRSLVENAYIFYAKKLLIINNKEKTNSFIKKLAHLCDAFPSMRDVGYYYARLLLTKLSVKQTFQIISKYIDNQDLPYWFWMFFADLEQTSESKIACYMRCLNYHIDDFHLQECRLKFIEQLCNAKYFETARLQIDILTDSLIKTNSSIPLELINTTNEHWYLSHQQNKIPFAIDYWFITQKILKKYKAIILESWFYL